MKSGIVIQARTRSTRLPGKVVKNLGNKTLLGFLIDRLKQTKLADQIIVATTDKPEDDVIENIAKRHNVYIFRGSSEDVLGRYYGAAKEYNLDVIVRVTADNPFTDYNLVDKLIATIQNGANYATGSWYYGWFPGLSAEAFDLDTLALAYSFAPAPHSYREHVTPYMKHNPEHVKTVYLRQDRPFLYSLTVDYPEDYAFVSRLIEDGYLTESSTYEEIANVLTNHFFKWAVYISHLHEPFPVVYYPVEGTILVYTGGSEDIGLGHIVREGIISNYLKNLGFSVYWTGLIGNSAKEYIRRFIKAKLVDSIMNEKVYDGVIHDLTDDPFDFYYIDINLLNKLREISYKLFLVKDILNLNSIDIADLVFNTYPAKGSNVKFGFSYLPINPQIMRCPYRQPKKETSHKVLIYSGGSRQCNGPLYIVKQIRKVLSKHTEIRTLVSTAFPTEFVDDLQREIGIDNVYQTVDDLCPLLEWADIVISSYGNFMFEALALQKPTYVYAYKDTYIPMIKYLEEKKIVKFMGYPRELRREVFLDMLEEPHRERTHGEFIDGWGLYRISQEIAYEILKEHFKVDIK